MLKLVKGLDKNLALENMSGMKMNRKFFDRLVVAIENARRALKKMKKDSIDELTIWEEIEFRKEVQKIVKDETNMNLTHIGVGDPAIELPMLSEDNIFVKNKADEHRDIWSKCVNDKKSVIDMMASAGKETLVGTVNPVSGEVGGFYANVMVVMYMPPSMFLSNRYTSEELAAIMLHEFGHAYTTFLYMNRMILNNQVLAAMAQTYTSGFPSTDRVYVFEHFCNANKVSPEQAEALKRCKTMEEVTVVYMSNDIEACRSELGYSLYDVTSCEQLADQYAAQMGGGQYLVSSLDKLYEDNYATDRGLVYFRCMRFAANLLVIFAMAVFFASTPGLLLFIKTVDTCLSLFGAIFGPDKRQEIYDNPYARLNRIKQLAIDKLKDDRLSKKEKEIFLKDVESVNEVLHKYSDGLKMEEVFAYMFRPAYRKAHKFEMLQKELETLASNELFVNAAKLKMI